MKIRGWFVFFVIVRVEEVLLKKRRDANKAQAERTSYQIQRRRVEKVVSLYV